MKRVFWLCGPQLALLCIFLPGGAFWTTQGTPPQALFCVQHMLPKVGKSLSKAEGRLKLRGWICVPVMLGKRIHPGELTSTP